MHSFYNVFFLCQEDKFIQLKSIQLTNLLMSDLTSSVRFVFSLSLLFRNQCKSSDFYVLNDFLRIFFQNKSSSQNILHSVILNLNKFAQIFFNFIYCEKTLLRKKLILRNHFFATKHGKDFTKTSSKH